MDLWKRPVGILPAFVEKVWGGARFPPPAGSTGPVGEVWLLSGMAVHPSRLADEPEKLWADVFDAHRGRILGPDASGEISDFPLLVKIIDTEQVLSVQVHPSRPGFSKDECWYVLDAREDAELYCGFRPGVARADVEAALEGGRLPELLQRFRPRAGEVYHVPPGTVHALGAGLTVLEIQEPLNVTFRLYDWDRPGLDGRPRDLQIEKGLRAMTLDPVRAGLREQLPMRVGVFFEKDILLARPTMILYRFRIGRDIPLQTENRMNVWVCTAGGGELAPKDADPIRVKPFDTFVLPASMERTVLLPDAEGFEFVQCWAPPRTGEDENAG
jgi:mannose-6-phosphate isomerase